MTTKPDVSSTNIRIEDFLKEELTKISKSRKMTFSKLMKEILQEYLLRYKKLEKIHAFEHIRREVAKVEGWAVQLELEFVENSRKTFSNRLKLI
jgi:hypothetical protein